MKLLRTIAELRAELAAGPRPAGLVPTMGALHAGHAALIERARSQCEQVVVSIFVNPTQFNDEADFAHYPRNEAGDARVAGEAGATLVFAPAAQELYPHGFRTSVRVAGPLTETLEGAQRGAEHFHGVTTIVTKLLNIVAPDVAYFGQKDAQQALVIRRLVRDLDMTTRVEVIPTVRESDGLALSSRNVRLAAPDRERALSLSRALDAARSASADTTDPDAVRAAGLRELVAAGLHPEYFAVVDPETLAPLTAVNGSGALIAVAARVGEVRLIDNVLLTSNRQGT